MTTKNPAFDAALALMQANYGAAKQRFKNFSGESLPEGEYNGRQTECKFYHNKEKQTLSIINEFTVVSGELVGRTQTDFMQLSNEIGLSFAMDYVDKMGYEIPETPSDWVELVETIKKLVPAVKFQIVMNTTKDGRVFSNLRVIERLDDSEVANVDKVIENVVDKAEPKVEVTTDTIDLNLMSRKELKKYRTEKGYEIKVTTKMSDDELRDAIRKLEPVVEEEEEDDDTGDKFDTMSRKELKKYRTQKGYDIKVTTKMTDNELRNAVREYEATDKSDKAIEKLSDGSNEIDNLKVDILAMAANNNLDDLTDSMDVNELKQKLATYQVPKDEIEPEEIELITKLGLEAILIEE